MGLQIPESAETEPQLPELQRGRCQGPAPRWPPTVAGPRGYIPKARHGEAGVAEHRKTTYDRVCVTVGSLLRRGLEASAQEASSDFKFSKQQGSR